MFGQLIDGKQYAAQIKLMIKQYLDTRLAPGQRPPGLAVMLVGNDPASSIYVHNKRLACQAVGITSSYYSFPTTVKENTVLAQIEQLNADPKIDGILLQLPLPTHLNTAKIVEHLSPEKDVDGLGAYQLGCLAKAYPLLRPCTPYGILYLLQQIKQPIQGKHVVIVGASNIVGKPMAFELLMQGATVTICQQFSEPLSTYVAQAEILISAVGIPQLIKGAWIKPGATVIDVGITRLPDGSFTGDIEFSAARERARWITPVPGGVGPMTVAMLLRNTMIAAGLGADLPI